MPSSQSKCRLAWWLYNHNRICRALSRLGFRQTRAWIVGYGDTRLTGTANPISGAYGAMHRDHKALVEAYRRGESCAAVEMALRS